MKSLRLIIYRLSIKSYANFIYCFAFFHPKARLWIEGRKNWQHKLRQRINTEEKWIWFHCSSLGEYEDCSLLFQEIDKLYPKHKKLLTFFSPTGYEYFKENQPYDVLLYLPIDTKKNAQEFIAIVQPQLAFFSRSELWYHYINELHHKKIKFFLCALSLTKESKFLHWSLKSFYAEILTKFTAIFCQNEQTKGLLDLNSNKTTSFVTGNPRIDRIVASKEEEIQFPLIAEFTKYKFTIVVGSSLAKDEKILKQAIKELNHLEIRWIIVPHEIKVNNLKSWQKEFEDRLQLYSRFNPKINSTSIVVIDNVGSLKYMYQYASIAIIGGGFNAIGIHSILEPAIYGVSSFIGPNHRNYAEALDFLAANELDIFANSNELIELIINQIEVPNKTSNYLLDYLERNKNATNRTLELIQLELTS